MRARAAKGERDRDPRRWHREEARAAHGKAYVRLDLFIIDQLDRFPAENLGPNHP